MKRFALLFAFLFTFSSAFISCRETGNNNEEVELQENVEDVGNDIEDAGEEIEDEID